ncbi:type I-C CRISPR-associated protein Cas8c/Csd1 [Bisgaard Taxon 10/6]|uniref:type I-C CRISPR-associated protein Cas8c/Csd1 n=1 Tax=Exercitatus varius TaxID=67857 RepID=UPI0018A5BD6B|nr:type I-C CRISPR-associated protein Cas8c/Csd1 [Exercitatus varius]MDG2915803.1 type I-C CRISPR-associated protein Cas8c/Csd1 [Exercitatus varius]MDG2957711.1 type I-C CRISPR-associated protein Cas8c/Csd1 [Exercitatus varius]QOF68720.1 type I-C CRISPR-associated protein Cas8c/Csd1 [Actinobacillus sp. GY-402]
MSWMQKLYRTYETVSGQTLGSDDEPLTPVGHTLQNAHIVIVLNGQGEFQTARVMPPKMAIMLPATESSENRTSGEAPHPLADKIQYVAKDYVDYGGAKKAYFDGYLKQLQAWCASAFKHPKVQAVLDYVSKGTVVADLAQAGIFQLDSDGQVLNKWEADGDAPPIFSVLPKTKGEIEFGSALVCWSVEIAGDVHSETWTDQTVQQSWIDYLGSSAAQKGFCLVQGIDATISTMHPAKLRHTGDKAKLISSNDSSGYTFRGRFETAEEAASVSTEVSAKAHSALRWLIGRQGIRNGDQVTVAWAISGKEIPSPMRDSFDYFDIDNVDTSAVENEAELSRPSENESSGIDWSVNIGQQAAAIIKKKLHGYKKALKEHEQISLLMLDSATPGRMALTYYQEFLPGDYFANLDAWIDDFSWYQRHSIEKPNGKKSDKQTLWAFLPPSPYAIGYAVYGQALSDTLKKQLYARLLPVIAGGKNMPMPYDLVQKSFQAACNPNGSEHWEWQRNIGVACALYKGWRARHHDLSQRRTYLMSLDTENRSRDYLFGRLLAVGEKLESTALWIADEKRSTNAERYMQRFAVRPLSTWLQIELSLEPYKNRLRSNRYMGFLRNREKEIDEIMAALNELNSPLDKPLDGEFLLGYHSQRMAYRNSPNTTSEQDEQE